jgi:Fe-S cluster assembly protein SufD
MQAIHRKDYTEQLAAGLASIAGRSEKRLEAWNHFRQLGLPTSKSEEYKFTPLTRWLEKSTDWTAPSADGTDHTLTASLRLPLSGPVAVLVNGVFSPVLSSIPAIEGLSVQPLADETPQFPAGLHAHPPDPFAALNAAAYAGGLVVHVAQGVRVAEPLTVLHVQTAGSQPIQVHARLLVHLGADAQLTLVQQTNTLGNHRAFHTVVEEIMVENKASLDYYKIQDDRGKSGEVWNTAIRQADESRVDTFTLTMGGELVRNNFRIEVAGEYCESHFHGLYLLQGDTLADNHTVVDHQKPHSFSNEMYKGVMADRAKGVFNGKIFVRPHAQKTNAYQSNRNILLSDTATVNTKPQLEIWADDVKCSHGCTTGQLDENALFYLRSRGLAEETARAMLLYAFAAETLDTIRNPALKEHIDKLVSGRLHKDF